MMGFADIKKNVNTREYLQSLANKRGIVFSTRPQSNSLFLFIAKNTIKIKISGNQDSEVVE